MEFRLKMILGSVLAMILGLGVSSPILMANLGLTGKVQIEVEVAYAYFGIQEFDRSVTGLWRNPDEGSMVSYLIVLNVTNLSNRLATMEDFVVAAAQEILVQNGSQKIGSEELARTSQASSNPPESGIFSVSMQNPVVCDERAIRWYPGWSQIWEPKSSRLIGLSGIIDISGVAYQTLTNGTVYLYGKAEGRPYEGGSQSKAFDLRLVQLQKIGREFLYNALVLENQILRIANGLDVFIQSRR